MISLVDHVKISTGFSEGTIATVIDSVVVFLAKSLRAGEPVKLEGLGAFKIIDKPEREGRNPRTGEATIFKAARRTKLVLSKNFLASIQPDPLAASVPELSAPVTIPPFPVTPEIVPMPAPVTIPPFPPEMPAPVTIPPELSASVTVPSFPMPHPQSLPQNKPGDLWKIKAPDDSFIEVPSGELSDWGVTKTTPVFSSPTGWQLAGKVPELAGIV
ncbi:MAG: HU family DNA-binding protein [Tychonema bourrellyi B0820]|nr:HU family DNA-binding protein [Tychonema bourrellyi B0820]